MATDQQERTAADHEGRRKAAPLVLAVVLGAALALLALFLFMGNVLAEDEAIEEGSADRVRTGQVGEQAYAAVSLGDQKEEVTQALLPARPVDTRVLSEYQARQPETPDASCVYYDREDGRLGQQYRFCFVEDQLIEKTVVLSDQRDLPIDVTFGQG